MAKINKTMVGESLVGDGNEVAHIDLMIGPKGGSVETAFCNTLTNNKDGFTSLLAVVAPNLPCKPNTVMFNKVTIKYENTEIKADFIGLYDSDLDVNSQLKNLYLIENKIVIFL